MPKRTTKPTQDDLDSVDNEDTPSEEENGSSPLTAQRVLDLFADAREENVTERLNYWINYAFWRGAQWLWCKDGYSTGTEITPVNTSEKARREQATLNRIKPAVHTVISSCMKVPVQLEVLAQSADDYAQHGAMTGESLLRQKGLNDDWPQLQEKWLTACYLGGTAAVVTTWNPEAHRFSEDITTGDAELEALTVEDFVVEPGSPDAKRARWWIRKQVLPAEAVQAMYGLKKKPKEDAVDGGPFSSRAVQFSSVLAVKRGTQVITYFERPNSLRPKGAVAVVVGTEFVWGGEPDAKGKITTPRNWTDLYPFNDHLNIEVGVCILDPNKIWGESPVTDAISPQRQYNSLWSKIHETTHRTVGSKLILDKRHADLNKKLTDDPEEPIYVQPPETGAADPHYLAPPQLPNGTVQQLEELKEAIDDALFNHPISRGVAGSNAPDSGYGLSILAENDATPSGRLLKEWARVHAGSGTNILELYAAKVVEKRETVIVERRGAAHPVKWDGKTLAGQTRAVVPPDSVLPRNHAGLMELGKQMMQMRPEWFKTPTQFLRFIMMPGVESMADVLTDDEARADYENSRMAQGVAVEVFDFDNHATHIEEHHHFMKSPRYLSLPEKSRQLFDLHIQNHKAYEAAATGAAAMLGGMHPALNANPLLGGGQPALALQSSGADIQTPQVPQGE